MAREVKEVEVIKYFAVEFTTASGKRWLGYNLDIGPKGWYSKLSHNDVYNDTGFRGGTYSLAEAMEYAMDVLDDVSRHYGSVVEVNRKAHHSQ